MYKLLFATVVVACLLNACAPSAKLNKEYTLSDKENYFHSKNAIPEELAKAMIEGFPKHNHRTFGKKKLKYSQAMFDSVDLNNVMKDPNVQNVRFFLAVQDGELRYPTIVMCATLKNQTKDYNVLQFMKAVAYCPPPPECTLLQLAK